MKKLTLFSLLSFMFLSSSEAWAAAEPGTTIEYTKNGYTRRIKYVEKEDGDRFFKLSYENDQRLCIEELDSGFFFCYEKIGNGQFKFEGKYDISPDNDDNAVFTFISW